MDTNFTQNGRTKMNLMHENLARAQMSARLGEAQQLRRGAEMARARRLSRKAEQAAQRAPDRPADRRAHRAQDQRRHQLWPFDNGVRRLR